jgi:MFS family permease
VITQHLYARLTAQEPYALFALSNAGSLLGLLLYPFVVEPLTDVSNQALFWAVGFGAFAICLMAVWQRVNATTQQLLRPARELVQEVLKHRWQIIALAAIPTFLLASTTEYLSKGIASFPLLWILPLVLYLISFIVAFSGRTTVRRTTLGVVSGLSILPLFGLIQIMGTHVVLYWIGSLFVMISFFLISVYFHQRVYQLRPAAASLGQFYIYMTFGGALGSGIVGLLLPFLLTDQTEVYYAFGALAVYFVFYYTGWITLKTSLWFTYAFRGAVVSLALLFVFSQVATVGVVAQDRNFYGTLKVIDSEEMVNGDLIPVRTIVNGKTNHGLQSLDARYAQEVGSYYGTESGVGIALRSFTERGVAPRVSVIGLGSGMMNGYCDELESISYIEINPEVEVFAREYFTYLDMCPEKTSLRFGDGRLLLEDEVAAGDSEYEVVVVDAFTDDAIPSHLLTNEAFVDAYQPLLSTEGIVAFHVSNRYLNLFPPIVGLARANGYEAVVVTNIPDGSNQMHLPTVWVLVTAKENAVTLQQEFASVQSYTGREILWTDGKNSVLDVLSWTGSSWNK